MIELLTGAILVTNSLVSSLIIQKYWSDLGIWWEKFWNYRMVRFNFSDLDATFKMLLHLKMSNTNIKILKDQQTQIWTLDTRAVFQEILIKIRKKQIEEFYIPLNPFKLNCGKMTIRICPLVESGGKLCGFDFWIHDNYITDLKNLLSQIS